MTLKEVSTAVSAANPAAPKLPKTFQERETFRRVIVVLHGATLEIARLGKSKDAKYCLLNGDDHTNLLKRHGKSPADYRPDITHQCLLTLLDSPLNRAGRLQVYIHTHKNVLIEVNPKTRIPRTYSRFAGLMVQLLHKLSVRCQGSSEKLLNVVKNPITDHLPTKCVRIGMSGDAPLGAESMAKAAVDVDGEGMPVVFWVGAMAHGVDRFPDAERLMSCSNYPLSASVVCSKICDSFESVYGIL